MLIQTENLPGENAPHMEFHSIEWVLVFPDSEAEPEFLRLFILCRPLLLELSGDEKIEAEEFRNRYEAQKKVVKEAKNKKEKSKAEKELNDILSDCAKKLLSKKTLKPFQIGSDLYELSMTARRLKKKSKGYSSTGGGTETFFWAGARDTNAGHIEELGEFLFGNSNWKQQLSSEANQCGDCKIPIW
jgi:hypothetical protein